MGLTHLKDAAGATETVKAPGGEFTVRGLSLVDFTALVREHGAALAGLFDQIKVRGDQLVLDDPVAMVGALSVLASQAPAATARIISLAADEEDVSIAAKFPALVQIDALEKIALLTFGSEGGIKKALETVIRVARGVVSEIAALKA